MYKVKNFVIYLNNDIGILQTQRGITTVNNNKMLNFLINVDNSDELYITEAKIKQTFKEATTQAIKFLLENKIIQKKPKYNFNIKKIILYTNDKIIKNFFEDYVKYSDINSVKTINDINKININDETLLITFFNPLDWKAIEKVYKQVNKNNSIWLLGYPYNNNFYFNNVYKRSWHVPCYKCIRAEMESRERINMFDETSYQQIVDQLYNNYPDFLIETKIKYSEAIKIVNLMQYIIDQFILLDEPSKFLQSNNGINILQTFQIDTINNRIVHETAEHWELCDCYE
ncbi:McbB family protein [Apilactobacillus micheneri]|uniref:McbB family protein n=1 Tax=Apilactobacillus micheneri TaxID=1899430 RepID=UPI00112EA14F|nr:McbB family protein [Apilactobacillus micheneri]TPR42306.1 McbB family protein [Apilactobacillus micheneri]TPR47006.1 McbB family protein [Apilactobacillus micheneri]